MNIKNAAFTVSEKSSNTSLIQAKHIDTLPSEKKVSEKVNMIRKYIYLNHIMKITSWHHKETPHNANILKKRKEKSCKATRSVFLIKMFPILERTLSNS